MMARPESVGRLTEEGEVKAASERGSPLRREGRLLAGLPNGVYPVSS
jgi:hypothetical protein